MKRIKYHYMIVAVAIILSACGANATPTMSMVNIQETAVAAAFTIVAQTQAAIPTVTPTETPTSTPAPTDTPAPSPTTEQLEVTVPPTQAQSSGNSNTNDCLGPLNVGGAGPGHKTVIKNQIDGVKSYTLSLQLYTPNVFGACGIISASEGSYDLPSGEWYALAWVTLKNGKNFTTSGSFYVQPAQFDKLELCLRKSDITYAPSC